MRHTHAEPTRYLRRTMVTILLSAFCWLLQPGGSTSALDLGPDRRGLSIGNTERWTGLRFNTRDRDVDWVDGMNMTLIGAREESGPDVRGINLGVTLAMAHEATGLCVGVLGAGASTDLRGLAVGSLGAGAGRNLTGIAFAGLAVGAGDDLRGIGVGGLAIGGLAIGAGSDLSGIGVSALVVGAGEKLSGIGVGGIAVAAGSDLTGATGTLGVAAAGNRLSGIHAAGLAIGAGESFNGIGLAGGYFRPPEVRGLALTAACCRRTS